jgi:hypothetical protein
VPYYSNGNPKYDTEGYALDENGWRLPDVPPLPHDEQGVPIYPNIGPTPSGGGSQTLAGQSSDWFEQVETPIYEEELSSG